MCERRRLYRTYVCVEFISIFFSSLAFRLPFLFFFRSFAKELNYAKTTKHHDSCICATDMLRTHNELKMCNMSMNFIIIMRAHA